MAINCQENPRNRFSGKAVRKTSVILKILNLFNYKLEVYFSFLTLCSSVLTVPLFLLFLCFYCPCVLASLCPSVPTISLSLCSSVPPSPLFLCPHCSSVPTVLIVRVSLSLYPPVPLSLCSSVSTVPLSNL